MKTRRSWELSWLAQAALIVLPVAILSGVALHFVREDKAAVQEEARDLAISMAPEAARQFGEAAGRLLSEELKDGRLQQGEIVDGLGWAVPDYPRLPTPAAPAASGGSRAARANAELGRLRAAERAAHDAGLVRQAIDLAEQYPTEVTESGVPVSDLAFLLALRHASADTFSAEVLPEMARHMSRHPSFLTPGLLEAAGQAAATTPARKAADTLRQDWAKQEEARERTREAMRTLSRQLAGRNGPTALAYEGSVPFLALCAPRDRGWRVTLVPEEVLREAMRPSLPAYMGAMVEIGGTRRRIPGGAGGDTFAPLASAAGSFTADVNYPFNLILDLAKPDALYAPFHRRLMQIEWLIFFAAAAALLGLAGLWRNHRAQAELGEMKSNLVSSVSHELRAPIAAVRLMAESLESGRIEDEGKRRDYYGLIVRECRRLSTLIENVLDFARIDQGSKQYRFEPLDPVALLRHTLKLMEPGAAERRVRLAMTDPPRGLEDLQPCWDGEAVEQSLVNLLDNAIKHSPAGAEVRVEAEASGEVVRFWVADQGPGIPATERQRIFERFYRRGSELRRETSGAGIGLSIVKHVAEAHGGHVLVESVVGQGSRFGLELPR